jgi:hypothetical protein
MKKLFPAIFAFILCFYQANAQGNSEKPRILISTDIGGTDDDDFQSMIHFLMYADRFNTEGLVSSPSYGNGSKQNIFEMISLYEKDLPKLKAHGNFPAPNVLRALCKQGVHGAAPFKGYCTATEGSDWIIKCANKKSDRPLWVLVWGGLEDVAQALHDAPQIKNRIKVYWIGGPNKKWSINAYNYVAKNFPDLWMIESNASYQGLFLHGKSAEDLEYSDYYDKHIQGLGYMGKQFKNYYGGAVKMGDTPSLLYVMNGTPNNPAAENWGGSFVKINRSARHIYERNTSIKDTVPVYSIVELYFKGPVINWPPDSSCFTMEVLGQTWPGYYLGNGRYGIRYSPKKAGVVSYTTQSKVAGFTVQKGEFYVNNLWPGKAYAIDYRLGNNWYSDKPDADLFYADQQGGKTVSKWRQQFLNDWAKRWQWLK